MSQSNTNSTISQNKNVIKNSPQRQEISAQRDKPKNNANAPQPTSQNSKVSADSKTNSLNNIKNNSNSSMGAKNPSRDMLASKNLTKDFQKPNVNVLDSPLAKGTKVSKQTESPLSPQTPHANIKSTISQDDKTIKKILEESTKIISSMKERAKEAQDAFQSLQNKSLKDTKQQMDQIKRVEGLIIIALGVIQVDYLSLEKVLSPYKNTYQNLLSEAHSLVDDIKKLKNDIKAILKKADEALIKMLTPEEKKKKMNENLEKIKTKHTLINKQLQSQSVSKPPSDKTAAQSGNATSQPVVSSQPSLDKTVTSSANTTSQPSLDKTVTSSANTASQPSSDKTSTSSGNATPQPSSDKAATQSGNTTSQSSSDKTATLSEINAESQTNVQNESGISSQASSGEGVHQPDLLSSMENKKFVIIQSESEEMEDIIAECQMLANESADLKNLLESQNDVILAAQKTLKSSENFIQEAEKKISEQIMNNKNKKNEGSNAINSGLNGIHQAHINDRPIILSN